MSQREKTTKTQGASRRSFLKTASAGAGLLILPSGTVFGQNAPSNKLNILLVGSYGRAKAHYPGIKTQNLVAMVDVNEKKMAKAKEEFPEAITYHDWREAIDRKDIDAVVCCTTDQTHAFVANWAMNRDLHVYCEKPLANTVEEARVCRAKYLSKKNKIAVQVGTQRHALENFNRVRELVHDGVIGELTDVHAWGNRQIRREGYLPSMGEPPEWIKWDLWVGPSPMHPYNQTYVDGGCLSWNMFWDFGSGQIGDMGSHTMDLAYNPIDADLPTTAEAVSPEKYNPEVTPVEMMSMFDLPANDRRGPIKLFWHQGGAMPKSPREYIDLNKIGHGALFKGKKGFIVADFATRLVIPYGDDANMTYYKPRQESELLNPLGDFQEEWINACKGDLKTSCDFDYAGKLIETMLLGLVAFRAGKKLEYDGATGRITNAPEANAYLSKEYREGWTLEG